MTSRTALFALLAAWGVGAAPNLPTYAEETASDSAAEATAEKTGFTNRVWTRADDGQLPGVMRIFLSDGTLVQDSCWETHRLSPWTMTSATSLRWDEDGMDIDADIVSLSESELVLSLKLGTSTVEEHYIAATVPYVCPDMPRD